MSNGFVSIKDGKYVWRYTVTNPADGRVIERCKTIGAVSNVGSRNDALEAAIKRGFTVPAREVPTFGTVAQDFVNKELRKREGAIGRKAAQSAKTDEFYLTAYILPRWTGVRVSEMRVRDVEKWLESLATVLKWETVSKIRGVCSLVMQHGLRDEVISPEFASKNPFRRPKDGGARCRTVSDPKDKYEAIACTQREVVAILEQLAKPETKLEWTVTFLAAATAMRPEEIFGLQWQDILWNENVILLRRAWSKGAVTEGKTYASMKPMPMHPILASYVRQWQAESTYTKLGDWVFASTKSNGKVPRDANMIGKHYLRPAAIAAKVLTPVKDGSGKVVGYENSERKPVLRFGLSNLRHSLATWLSKTHDVTTASKMLRHTSSRTTDKYYIHQAAQDLLAAQGAVLEALKAPSATTP
jgi:integrase